MEVINNTTIFEKGRDARMALHFQLPTRRHAKALNDASVAVLMKGREEEGKRDLPAIASFPFQPPGTRLVFMFIFAS